MAVIPRALIVLVWSWQESPYKQPECPVGIQYVELPLNTLTLPCLMTLLTASDTIWEWYSRLQCNTGTIKRWPFSFLAHNGLEGRFSKAGGVRWASTKVKEVRQEMRCTSYNKNQEGDSLEVPEHVSCTEQHSCGVGNVPSYSLCKGVACTLKREETHGIK